MSSVCRESKQTLKGRVLPARNSAETKHSLKLSVQPNNREENPTYPERDLDTLFVPEGALRGKLTANTTINRKYSFK